MTTTELFAVELGPRAFPVLRAGDYEKGGRKVRVTEADLDHAVRNFEADQARGMPVPIDYDHSFQRGGDSRAAGWIRSMIRRGRELLIEVDWTQPARELIERDEYRSISAEFHREHRDEAGSPRGFAVVAAGLTNRPFLRDLGAVALSQDRLAEAERFLAEAERLIAEGNYNIEAVAQQVRAARLMAERGLDYAAAAAEAYREVTAQ